MHLLLIFCIFTQGMDCICDILISSHYEADKKFTKRQRPQKKATCPRGRAALADPTSPLQTRETRLLAGRPQKPLICPHPHRTPADAFGTANKRQQSVRRSHQRQTSQPQGQLPVGEIPSLSSTRGKERAFCLGRRGGHAAWPSSHF